MATQHHANSGNNDNNLRIRLRYCYSTLKSNFYVVFWYLGLKVKDSYTKKKYNPYLCGVDSSKLKIR